MSRPTIYDPPMSLPPALIHAPSSFWLYRDVFFLHGTESATTTLRQLGYTGLIVGLTGNDLSDDLETFLQAGADCVYAKPFREHDLTALMSHLQKYGFASNATNRAALRMLLPGGLGAVARSNSIELRNKSGKK